MDHSELISNEGNARLATTRPRLHVALVGLEKLVPDLSAALRIIKVLIRPAGMKTFAEGEELKFQ